MNRLKHATMMSAMDQNYPAPIYPLFFVPPECFIPKNNA